jgi:hypothetical protein
VAQEYCADFVILAVFRGKDEKMKGGVCQNVKDRSEKMKNKIGGRKM